MLETVDVVTKESTVSFRERTDVTAVPAMGVVAESMMALVLATEALRKFGGDSLAEVVRNRDGFVAALGTTPSSAVGSSGRGPGHRSGMTPRILLVGMMGAGKTTTGRLLAERLGWGYRDSDADVEAATGLTVPELFARDGEAAFRRAEAGVLADACADPAPSVVSVAGGAVLSEDNRQLIAASGIVVWLRARPETLAARVGDGAGRPLLGDDPAEALVRLNAVRAPLYAEVADVVIDVDDLDPASVVAAHHRRHGRQRRHRPATRRRANRRHAGQAVATETTVHALSVDLADRSYPVLVGPGARHEVARFVPPGAKSAVIVTQESIEDAGWVEGLDPGVPFEVCRHPRRRGRQDARHRRGARPLLRPAPGSRAPTSSSPSAAAS